VVSIVFVESRELKMNFTFLVAISLLFPVWSWLDTEVRAQQDDLVTKAQKERALVVTGTALASQGERYLKAFKERYPFLNTTYSRASGESLTSKLLAEATAGQLGVDVILINNYTHRIFMKRNIIVPYLTSAAKTFPAGLADPNGHWIGFYIVPYAIEYNTRMVDKSEIPKSFDDLLHPRWKGRMSLEQEEYLVTQGHLAYLGKDKAVDYFRKLARQDLRLVKGHSQQTVLLSAGEFALNVYNDIARTEEYRKKGAPVAWVDAEPLITVVVAAAMTRTGRNPNAAKLFLDFVASDAGQKEVLAMEKPPALPKYRQDFLKGVQLYPADWSLSDSFDEHNKLFREIFWKNK
jgi:iron(III) transport system substrate-binding protein